jgi:hypothetical protein
MDLGLFDYPTAGFQIEANPGSLLRRQQRGDDLSPPRVLRLPLFDFVYRQGGAASSRDAAQPV